MELWISGHWLLNKWDGWRYCYNVIWHIHVVQCPFKVRGYMYLSFLISIFVINFNLSYSLLCCFVLHTCFSVPGLYVFSMSIRLESLCHPNVIAMSLLFFFFLKLKLQTYSKCYFGFSLRTDWVCFEIFSSVRVKVKYLTNLDTSCVNNLLFKDWYIS